MVEFLDTEEPVEVVPHVRANLSFTFTGGVAVWVESERPEASAYHLWHPYNDRSFPAVEFINGNWYYLDWNNGKYYTGPQSRITTPIGLGLGTCEAPSINATLLLREPVHTPSVSEQTKESHNTPEDEDEPVLTQDQEEEGGELVAIFNRRVTISGVNREDVFAFGFNASALPAMATTMIQQTMTGTNALSGSAEMHRTFTSLGTGGRPNEERSDGLEAGGGGPPFGNPGQPNP